MGIAFRHGARPILSRVAVAALALTAVVVTHAQDEEAAPAEQGAAAAPAAQPAFGQPGLGIAGFAPPADYLSAVAGAAYTDNAFLTPEGRSSTVIGTAGLLADYGYVGNNIDALATGNLNWLHYFDHAFGDTLYGNFNGTAMWGHSTDLLQWLFRETYTEGQADPLAAETPAYYEEVNYFTTGPYLNFNFAALDRLSLFGLYSNTAFENSPFGSQSYEGGASLTHALSGVSSVSMLGSSTYTHYQDPRTPAEEDAVGDEEIPASSSYNMRTAEFMYNARLARTQFAAAAGYSWEDYGNKDHYSGSPIASLQLGRVLNAYSTIYIRGMYGYQSYGDALRGDIGGPLNAQSLGGGAPGFATAAPLKDHEITAGWNFIRARTTFTLTGGFVRQEYIEESAFNSKGETLTASLARQLRQTVWLRLSAFGSYYEYGNLGGRTTLAAENLSLVKQFDKVGFSVYYQRTHQAYAGTANPLGLATGAFVENRVGIEATYDIIGHRAAGAAAIPGVPGL